MFKTAIKCIIVCYFMLLLGCIDESPQSKVDKQFYLSGSPLSSIEKTRTTIGLREQVWKPHGLTVFWYRNGSVLKKENYIDGTLSGQYLEYFPTGEERVKAHLTHGGIRKQWQEFDINGACIINKSLTEWNIGDSANGRSNIDGKMVLFSDLYQEPENKLFFSKTNNLLFSGIAISKDLKENTVFESYNFLGGEIRGKFSSGGRDR